MQASKPAASATTKPTGTATKKVLKDQGAPKSASDLVLRDLQPQADAVAEAIKSGTPQQVVSASQRLAAVALLRLANVRMAIAAYSQALELYRKSLALQDVPETRLNISLAALRTGQLDEAYEQISRVLGLDASDPRAWHLKGKYWMAKGEYQAAAESLNKSLQLKDNPNVRYALALALLGGGKKQAADQVFQSMFRDYGDRAIWHVVFGGGYQQAGYLEDAIREFRRAIAIDTRVSQAHFYLGFALLAQNHWARTEESMAELRQSLQQEPRNFVANLLLGIGESQLKDFVQSNEHLTIASEVQPQAAEPWLYRGLNAYQQDRFDQAKPYLLKAIELAAGKEAEGNFQIRRAYIALSRIEFVGGNKPDGERFARKAKELQEKAHVATAENLAEMTGGMGGAVVMPHQKLPEPNAIQDALPADPAAQLDEAALVNATQKPEEQEQLKVLEKRLRGVLSQCYNDWATAEARQQLYPLALEHFQEAERWDNTTRGLMRNVGLAALRVGDSKEAERALEVAVQQDAADHTSRARLAMLFFADDNYSSAAKQFEALGDAVFQDASLTYAWGFSLARIKEQKRATEVLNRLDGFQLPPETLLSVGDIYGVMQDYDHAILNYRKALQLNPVLPKAHYKTGAALIRLSRPADAIPELEAELKLSPEDVDVQYNLAYALLRTSEKERAMPILRSIVSAHPEHPGAQYELGKTLLDSGDLEGGVQCLEKAAKLDPERDYIHYQLQTAYRRLGRKEDADREAAVYKELKTRQREQATIPQPQKQE
jgi:tetratricopeptide (TPR) repeat protein